MSGFTNGEPTDAAPPQVYIPPGETHAAALALTELFIKTNGQIDADEAASYYLKVRRRLHAGR